MHIVWLITFLLIIFENPVTTIFSIFSNIDELVFIICICLFLISFLQNNGRVYVIRLNRETWISLSFFTLFVLVAILSTINSDVNPKFDVIVRDFIAFSKFFITYYSLSYLFINKMDARSMKLITSTSEIIITVIFLFGIFNIVGLTPHMSLSVRNGLNAYKFIYSHYTFLVSSVVLMLAQVIVGRNQLLNKYTLMANLILLMTLRNKAYVVVGIYFTLVILVNLLKYKEIKVDWKYIGFGIFGTFILSYEKLIETMSHGLKAARPALYIVGYSIASDYFPFGSGFGTFATYISGKYYSPLYSMYDIDTVWGITSEKFNYIADTFWPAVYGQFGVMGFAFYLLAIYFLFKSVLVKHKSRYQVYSIILLISYILTASFVEAFITNVSGVSFGVFFALFLGNGVSSEKYDIKI